MEFEIIRDPVYLIKIKNMFSEKVNKKILKEAISLEKDFKPATIGNEKLKPDFRDNLILSYEKSYTRDLFTDLMSNHEISQVLNSSPHPFSEFQVTSTHTTQVSRYGENHHYNWHTDRVRNSGLLTFIYYFNKKPKKYSGGEIEFTSSPTIAGNLVDKKPTILTIEPENNMGLIISGMVSHRVLPTHSPDDFDQGRFAINCFVGMN